jgi:ankyrin repeat protein
VVQYLIDLGAALDKANKFGKTGLIYAAIANGPDAVKALIDTKKVDINKADYEGRTGLMYGAFYGFSEVVNYFLSSGAEIKPADKNGDTACNLAFKKGHSKIIDAILLKMLQPRWVVRII